MVGRIVLKFYRSPSISSDNYIASWIISVYSAGYYDVYGNPYAGRFLHMPKHNPYGFTGQRFEPELRMYSFAYRTYNPVSMRWMTEDPVKDGLNWYQYVSGDPINLWDPLGLSYKLTVYVDQPGFGGDDDTYEIIGFCVDVGHTFVELENEGTEEKITRGFYPSETVNPFGNKEVPGVIIDDSNHDWDVRKEILITEDQYLKAKEKIIQDEENPPYYNLDSYNCTDWAEDIAQAAGQSIPDTKGKWPGGGGSNPGQLGEELMKQGGERNVCNE